MLRGKLAELAALHGAGDAHGLAFALRASLLRNFAGICHPELSAHSRIGTVRIVEDYVAVVSYLLAYLAQSEPARRVARPGAPTAAAAAPPPAGEQAQPQRALTVEKKLLMFNEARIAYGRTALMLSGGASMGIHHLGVVKALLGQGLMPKVVCGTSAGALVASIVGILEDCELSAIIASDDLHNPLTGRPFSFRYFDDHASNWRRLRRFLRTGVIQDVRMLQDCLRRNYGDITFQEAYARTRRILNITVCAVRASSDPPMLLNYLTAPNVLVWSAASASCALPFVFAPVELVAKGYDGRVVPYHPHGVRWIDGSITSDIPLARIGELFNVNHFIVSQTNPHVIPRGTPLLKTRLAMLLKSELQFRYWQLLQLGLVPRVVAAVFPHFMQPYEGDITIMPEVALTDLLRLLRNPTLASVKESIERGERQTFPFLDRIRRQCVIEQVLDASVEHVARASARPTGVRHLAAEPDGTRTPGSDSGPRPIKRGNSFFGRVPSWLWLDAGSLLGSGPVSAMASRISAMGGASSSAVEKLEREGGMAKNDGQQQGAGSLETSHGKIGSSADKEADGEMGAADITRSPSKLSEKWARRLYGDAQATAGSPLLESLSLDPSVQGPLSELEQMWVEFGVKARAERSAVEPGNADMAEGTGSDGSTEEERILC